MLAPRADQTWGASQLPGLPGRLLPGFQYTGSPHVPAGYNYGVKLRITPAGLSPARTTASLAAPPVTRFPDPASGAYFGFPDSPWARSFAPSTPPGIAPLCSPTSSLLLPSLTSACRSSSATDFSFPLRPHYDNGETCRSPRSRWSASVRAMVLGPRGASLRLTNAAQECCLRSQTQPRRSEFRNFVAQ